MRVLYIHQYFCTRGGRSGTRSYEFARRLVSAGHRVTMLTSTSELSDVRLPGRSLVGRFDVDGIDVIAVRIGYSQRMGAAGRVWSFVRFMLISTWLACRAREHDVIVATSTPLTVGVPGLIASRLNRLPLVFEVRDLWPEAPIQMGAIRNPLVIAALRWFERTVYRHSRHLIALSPGMRDGVLATGVPASRVSVISNCSDLDLFKPNAADSRLQEQFGLRGRFVVGYAGSFGAANDVAVLLDAATRLRDRTDIVFLLIGQGSQEDELRQRIAALHLDNVRFGGSVPRQDVARMLNVFDVALVLFKDLPVLATNSPNKLFDALAAGCPVIVNSNGWTRRLVEEHQVGRYALPGSGESLAAQIRWLSDNDAECAAMQLRARRLAEEQFDRARLAQQFEAVLARACGARVLVELENAPHSPVASVPVAVADIGAAGAAPPTVHLEPVASVRER